MQRYDEIQKGLFFYETPCIKGGPKTRLLCLTAHIFKTHEPICVIFGRLQQYFVLNTSINSILNKFMTQVAPSSDKINNSVFHFQNHTRPLYSNVHFWKILAPIFPTFGTIQHRDSPNMSVNFIFIKCLIQSNAIWQKTTNR